MQIHGRQRLMAIGLTGLIAAGVAVPVFAQSPGDPVPTPQQQAEGRDRHDGVAKGVIKTAAEAIGIDPKALADELKGGKTIAQVATAHNVSAQKVIDALVAAANAHIQQAIDNGKITAAQGAELKSKTVAAMTKLVNEGLPHKGDRPADRQTQPHDRAQHGTLSTAAAAIGIDPKALLEELKGGKTIAQVATAHNVSAQKVIDALVADANTHIDEALAKGKITAAKGAELKDKTVAAMTKLVNEGLPHKGDRPADRQTQPHDRAQHGTLSTAAAAIGIDPKALADELKGGKTIAQVATAHNVTAQAVIDALAKAFNAHVDEAVTNGELDAAKAAEMKAKALERFTKLVNEGMRKAR